MKRTLLVAAPIAALLITGLASAQQNSTDQTQETNPQSSASTTVKQPAGVSTPATIERNTQGVTGAQTGCKSASAEMTNGAVETCKK